MANNRYNINPYMFKPNGDYRAGSHNNFSIQQPREPAESTIIRRNAIQEIYDRVKNGEDVDKVCLELAQRENIKKVYRVHLLNKEGLTPEKETEAISAFLKNAYLARKRNEDKVAHINGLR